MRKKKRFGGNARLIILEEKERLWRYITDFHQELADSDHIQLLNNLIEQKLQQPSLNRRDVLGVYIAVESYLLVRKLIDANNP